MTRVRNCAVCKNSMMLDFQKDTKEAICPHCGAALKYRLLGKSMFEIVSDALPPLDEDLAPALCG